MLGAEKSLVLGCVYGVLMLRGGSHLWEIPRVPGPGSAPPSPVLGSLITQLRVPSYYNNTMVSPWGLFPHDSPKSQSCFGAFRGLAHHALPPCHRLSVTRMLGHVGLWIPCSKAKIYPERSSANKEGCE